MNLIGKNIRYLRTANDMGQDELARLLGKKNFTTVQKWESGVSTPPLGIFIQMAELFNVDLDDFARVDLQSPDYIAKRSGVKNPGADNNVSLISIPLYCRIPADIPLEKLRDTADYIELSSNYGNSEHDHFALMIMDDSMMPKYKNGDIVIFERQDACKNGDECIIRLAGEDASFRKLRKLDHSIILQPLNPDYDPIQIDSTGRSHPVEILGIAKEILRKV